MVPQEPYDFTGAAGRLLLIAGALLVLAGVAVLLLGDRMPRAPRLPGDVLIERPGFTLYFPIGTSLLASVLLTLILYLIGRLRG